VSEELRSLAPANSETVAKHLVMAGRLIDEDPELAYQHAKAAQRTAARVASVREACGLTAYAAGHYAEALAELRAARRMSGSQQHLPVMADCERGLGRPERALAVASSDEAKQLDHQGQIEMRIVASGARRDLGQLEAAVVTLQVRELSDSRIHPWTARLRYAYADALLAAGRNEEALGWFRRAADADPDGETDAAERVDELEGVSFIDVLDEDSTAFVETVTQVQTPGVVSAPVPEPSPVSVSETTPSTEAAFAVPQRDELPAVAPSPPPAGAEATDAAEDRTAPSRPTYGAGLFQEPVELATDAPPDEDQPPA
jgi:tetratricopeptide (TPR) repeat protein